MQTPIVVITLNKVFTPGDITVDVNMQANVYLKVPSGDKFIVYEQKRNPPAELTAVNDFVQAMETLPKT